MARSPILCCRIGAFLMVLATVGAGAGPAGALEVRGPDAGARYIGELTRAYAPCLVPNDTTQDGLPACSPTVTSACGFDGGSVELRTRSTGPETLLTVRVDNVFGPDECTTGLYTIELGLRVTADDPSCAGDRCTSEETVVSTHVMPNGTDDLRLRDTVLEDLLATELRGSHYEVLHATVLGPDGRPMAGVGIGDNEATSVFAEMGAGYAACTAPNTSGHFGAACSPPEWPSVCDTNGGVVRWRRHSRLVNPALQPTFDGVVGPSPACADGTYVVRSKLRITTVCTAGNLCTAADTVVSIPITAKKGKIDGTLYPIESIPGFATIMTSMEVLAIDVDDPAGALFATAAVTGALRLQQPKVSLALRDVSDPSDDAVRIGAIFPNASIDPTEIPGVTFTVTDRNGAVYHVTIPGPLWQLGEPIGTRWDFADQAGGIGGVTKASIKQYVKGGNPLGYKVKLVAKDVDLSGADLPGVNLVVAIPPPGGFAQETAQRNRLCKVGAKSFSCK